MPGGGSTKGRLGWITSTDNEGVIERRHEPARGSGQLFGQLTYPDLAARAERLEFDGGPMVTSGLPYILHTERESDRRGGVPRALGRCEAPAKQDARAFPFHRRSAELVAIPNRVLLKYEHLAGEPRNEPGIAEY